MLEENVTTEVIATKMCLFFSLFTVNVYNLAFKAIFLHWNTTSNLACQRNFLSLRIVMLKQITNYPAYKKYCSVSTFKN